MNTGQKGCFGEHIAILWLLRRGYEVFENVSWVGPADLVAWKPGSKPIFIDVKYGDRADHAAYAAQQKRKDDFPEVEFLIADDSGECRWFRKTSLEEYKDKIEFSISENSELFKD